MLFPGGALSGVTQEPPNWFSQTGSRKPLARSGSDQADPVHIRAAPTGQVSRKCTKLSLGCLQKIGNVLA
jgi:hypothetical protein